MCRAVQHFTLAQCHALGLHVQLVSYVPVIMQYEVAIGYTPSWLLSRFGSRSRSIANTTSSHPQVGHAACMCIFTAMHASVKAVPVLFIECAGAFLGLLVLGTGER